MPKFNQPSSTATKTVNIAGGEAFVQSPELEFVSILLTSFVASQFYRTEFDTVSRVVQLIDALGDNKFAAQAAIYTRNEFGMRSISHLVAGEIAKRAKDQEWTKSFFDKVVRRPDDMIEILAYYENKYGKHPIPNALKKGFAKAFNKFDRYQIAKYQAKGKAISLIDIVNVVRPVPTEKNAEALKLLVEDKLTAERTWEATLSKAGQEAKTDDEKQEAKSQAWKEMVLSGDMGYFAVLRNLRNILEHAPEVVEVACKHLLEEKLIRNSLVLPFRFITAIEQFEEYSGTDARTILQTLNKAIALSCVNVPKFEGDTLVCVDCSGSMEGRPSKIASLFAAVMVKSNNCDLLKFGDHANYVTYNPDDSFATISKLVRYRPQGTNFRAIFNVLNRAYNRIMIFSDMQGWIGYHNPSDVFNQYKKKYNCNPHVYSIDLNNYGTMMFPESQVYAIAGFSEKIFDIMKLLEQDKQALINKIRSIEI